MTIEPTTALALIQSVRPFVDRLLGQGVDVSAQIIGDTMQYYRIVNLVRLKNKTEKLLADNHINPRILPPSILLPLIEEASKVDDESVCDMFVNLLGSAADPSVVNGIHPSFSKMLAEMSPMDAQVLLSLKRNNVVMAGVETIASYVFVRNLTAIPHIDDAIIRQSLLNLTRLGIARFASYPTDISRRPPEGRLQFDWEDFGKLFVTAVTRFDEKKTAQP